MLGSGLGRGVGCGLTARSPQPSPLDHSACGMTTTHSFTNNGLQRALFKRPFLSLQQQQQQRAISRQSPRVNASSDASFPLGSVELSTTTTEAPASVPRWGRVTREEADGSGSSSPLDDRAPPPPPRAPSAPLKINTDLRLYRARLARMMAYMARDVGERRRLLRDAEAGLRRCLASDPTDARPYVALGRILLAQKRYDEARALYADGCANTGNANPYIWASWGYLEARAGNVSRARKLFDAAVVVDETHAAAWHKWGMLEMRQGNFLRARDLWTRGIQKCRRAPQKSNAYLYCGLAVMAAQLGKLGEARAWFEEGTATNEGKASCALWHAWAMVEARIGDAAAVRPLFRRSLQANARSRYAHLAWGMWERKQGNLAAARQLLARGAALNPSDPALFQARALAARDAGDANEARRVFKEGLAVDPSHLYLWQAWGVMEAGAGNIAEARRLFQEGVWADPGNRDVVYVFQAWGVLEWRAGDAALARELFKAALKVDPRNEPTWGTWIAMEEDLGRLEAAGDLRIRRAEQQWEYVIPSSFTTRPGAGGWGGYGGVRGAAAFAVSAAAGGSGNGAAAAGGGGGGDGSAGGADGGSGGPFAAVLAGLGRFFRARGSTGSSSSSNGSGGRARGNGGGGVAGALPREFLDDGDSMAALAATLSSLDLGGDGIGMGDGGGDGSGGLEPAAYAAPQEQQQQQQEQPQQPQQRRRRPPADGTGALPLPLREPQSTLARLAKRPNRPAAAAPLGSNGRRASSSTSSSDAAPEPVQQQQQ